MTLLYRPIDPARAAALVETDLNAAQFIASASHRPTARSIVATRSAQATANEEASGAGLVNFGMLVTATVTNEDRLPQAQAAIGSAQRHRPDPTPALLRGTRLRLRRRPTARPGPPEIPVPRRHTQGQTMTPAPNQARTSQPAHTAPARHSKKTRTQARPGPKGWIGRDRGETTVIDPAVEFRGTTKQVCGLWPWVAGAGTPMIGVPFGRHITTGATLCCDPISWFQTAHLISNPSCFVLGIPGLGQINRRQADGHRPRRIRSDPPHPGRPQTRLRRPRPSPRRTSHLARDAAEATSTSSTPAKPPDAAQRLTGTAKSALVASQHARKLTMVAGLVTILRKQRPSDREEMIIDRGLRILDDRHHGIPVLADLLQVLRDAPDDLRAVALDRGNHERYQSITEDLEASLIALTHGVLGETFASPTTNPMKRDRPVVFDVSDIDDAQEDLQAATLLACWSAGFGTVAVAHALADAGLEPRRHYFLVLDELWRALRAGHGMVDRVDALTRLNRQRGVGMAMISHTMKDLLSLPTPERPDESPRLRRTLRHGHLRRTTPRRNGRMLTDVIPLSAGRTRHADRLARPTRLGPQNRRRNPPPGRGNFLVKVGGRPGIPVHVDLTRTEIDGTQRHQQAVAPTIPHRNHSMTTPSNRNANRPRQATETTLLFAIAGGTVGIAALVTARRPRRLPARRPPTRRR